MIAPTKELTVDEIRDQANELELKINRLEIDRAKKNLLLWGKHFLPDRYYYNTFSQMHIDIARAVLDQGELPFTGPRGWGKSTTVSVTTPLYIACEHEKFKRNFILIVSSTPALCKDFVRQIRDQIEGNPRIREEYGSLVGHPWKEGYIKLSNGVQILAVPWLTPNMRGLLMDLGRPDVYILDDAEIERNVLTEKARTKSWNWFSSSLMFSRDPRRNPIIIHAGTLMHWKSVLGRKIKENGKIYLALDENDKSNWEERDPTEALLEERRKMDKIWFDQEKQGIPAQGIQVASYLKKMADNPSKYTRVDAKEFEEIWVGIDLAKSITDGSDYTAFGMVGIKPAESNRKIYEFHILDLFRERLEIPDQLTALFSWIGQTKITGFVVESTQHQEAFAYDIEEELDKRHMPDITVVHYIPHAPKKIRLRNMLKYCGGNRLVQIADIPLKDICIEQAAAIDDDNEHDDLIDTPTSVFDYVINGNFNIRQA